MNNKFALIFGSIAALAMVGTANAQDRKTPKSFDYEIVDGKRVPKAKRTTNEDGSWREERREGKCTTVKEKTAAGELKITRTCDPIDR